MSSSPLSTCRLRNGEQELSAFVDSVVNILVRIAESHPVLAIQLCAHAAHPALPVDGPTLDIATEEGLFNEKGQMDVSVKNILASAYNGNPANPGLVDPRRPGEAPGKAPP